MRVSRVALALISAECRECNGELLPDCLLDRVAAGDDLAIDLLEAKHDRSLEAHAIKMPGRKADSYRCGCQAWRSADASVPCGKCGTTQPATTSYMHPRAARVRGGDMPMPF